MTKKTERKFVIGTDEEGASEWYLYVAESAEDAIDSYLVDAGEPHPRDTKFYAVEATDAEVYTLGVVKVK